MTENTEPTVAGNDLLDRLHSMQADSEIANAKNETQKAQSNQQKAENNLMEAKARMDFVERLEAGLNGVHANAVELASSWPQAKELVELLQEASKELTPIINEIQEHHVHCVARYNTSKRMLRQAKHNLMSTELTSRN